LKVTEQICSGYADSSRYLDIPYKLPDESGAETPPLHGNAVDDLAAHAKTAVSTAAPEDSGSVRRIRVPKDPNLIALAKHAGALVKDVGLCLPRTRSHSPPSFLPPRLPRRWYSYPERPP
jgi:hypothetical protein